MGARGGLPRYIRARAHVHTCTRVDGVTTKAETAPNLSPAIVCLIIGVVKCHRCELFARDSSRRASLNGALALDGGD